MTQATRQIFRPLGYTTLFIAAVLLLLYGMNLRSRFYYHGPDYSFLFWLFVWAATAGFGLLLLRKWALFLLFLPGIAFGIIFLIAIVKSSGMAFSVILLNALLVCATLAILIALLRFWKNLRW